MAGKWQNSKHEGIRYREHPTRKNGVRKDRYIAIYYRLNGQRVEEALGWETKGWTEKRAREVLAELQRNQREGKRPQTLKEKREMENAAHEAEQAKIEEREKRAMTLSEYFKEIYYPRIQRHKKQKTYEREESLFRMWIDEAIGAKPFKDIGRMDIENLFHKIVDKGRTIRTAEYVLTTLKQIWRSGKEDGYAPDMPKIAKAIKTTISKNDNARIRFLSHAEADKLLAEVRKKSIELYEKTLISIHCGLRAGEILGLRWSEVDQEHGAFRLKDTKSGKSRAVAMTQAVRDFMETKSRKGPDDLVYPGRMGKVPVAISATFQRVADDLFNEGISDPRDKVTFHTCRHTCASWMVMQGVSLYLVQKVLGHSTIQVTERYSHLAPDQLQLAANAIDRSLKEHKTENVVPFKKKA